MDPVSQGVIGAVAAQQFSQRSQLGVVTVIGLLSGMAPDLDVLFSSATDPLLSLEYHRQFTHSLFFIPFGGLICACVFYFLLARRNGISFKETYLYCTMGVASHGLLDAYTTYGTQLFWPFTDMRVAWNMISIIDPLFTLPLLILIVTAAIKKNKVISHAALGWVVVYSLTAIVQRERAQSVGWELAQSRGHQPLSLEAKPSFANLIVWKIVYTTAEKYYVDAVKVGFNTHVFEGDSVAKLSLVDDFPWLDANSQQAKDVERFRWFSNGYLATSPNNPNLIIDMRYSMLPNEVRGLWGIELDKNAQPDAHVVYLDDEGRSADGFKRLWEMIVY
ncbi:MAG: metal-dependent hydrolase [Pseudomonadota bacterium]